MKDYQGLTKLRITGYGYGEKVAFFLLKDRNDGALVLADASSHINAGVFDVVGVFPHPKDSRLPRFIRKVEYVEPSGGEWRLV